MSRPSALVLVGISGVLLAIVVGLQLLPGALYMTRHEGDAFHLLDILGRIQLGQRLHHEIATPIGGLAFWPFLPLLEAGLGAGRAFVLGQAAVGILILVPSLWVAMTRLEPGSAIAFVVLQAIMVTALAYGGDLAHVSVSMHYNRWAWALASVAVLIVCLPGRATRSDVDGVILGLVGAALLVLKATYAVALGPALLMVAIVVRKWVLICWGAAGFGLGVVLVTLLLGPAYWPAYFGDLWTVAATSVRPFPGLPLPDILTAPSHVAATALLLAAIVVLRRSGASHLGLALFLLAPAFFYITWQNFGNDPLWLAPVALLLIGQRTSVSRMMALAMMIVVAPPVVTMATSTLRHLGSAPADYSAIVPQVPMPRGGFEGTIPRAFTVNGLAAMDGPDGGIPPGGVDRPHARDFAGENVPECQVASGYTAWMLEIERGLAQAEISREDGIFVADVLSAIWLYGRRAPLIGGAPWYYGGLPGLEDADYVLVPLCPIQQVARSAALDALEERRLPLRKVAETKLFRLYDITP